MRVGLVGSVAVVLFDLVASLASRRFGFSYARASFGSYMLYLIIGFFAARGATGAPLRQAALAAAVAGLVDASLGWAISWQIGAGRLPTGLHLTVNRWGGTAVFVIAVPAAFAALGGALGRRRPPAEAPAGQRNVAADGALRAAM